MECHDCHDKKDESGFKMSLRGYGPISDVGLALKRQPSYHLSSSPNLYSTPVGLGLPKLKVEEIPGTADWLEAIQELGQKASPMEESETPSILEILRQLNKVHGKGAEVALPQRWTQPDFLLNLALSAPEAERQDYLQALVEMGAKHGSLAAALKRLLQGFGADLSSQDFARMSLSPEQFKSVMGHLSPYQRQNPPDPVAEDANARRVETARMAYRLLRREATPGSLLEHLGLSLQEQASPDMAESLLRAYREEIAILRGPTAFPGLNLLAEAFQGDDEFRILSLLQGEIMGAEETIRLGMNTTPDMIDLLQSMVMLDGSIRGADDKTEAQYWKEVQEAAKRLQPAQKAARDERLLNAGPCLAAELNRTLNLARVKHAEGFENETSALQTRLERARKALARFEAETHSQDSLNLVLDQLDAGVTKAESLLKKARAEMAHEEEPRATIRALDAIWDKLDQLATQLETRFVDESHPLCTVCGGTGSWGDKFCPGCGRPFPSF